MTPPDRSRPRTAPLLLALILGPACLALGQDLDEEETAKPGAMVQQNFAFDDSNFDAWVFNGRSGHGGGRAWFEAHLALKLDELDRVCKLSDAQKLKLRLAGWGDAKRFLDLYDEKFRKFQAVKHDQNKINEIFQEIQPLQQMLNNGAFGRGSMFGKTLASTLTGEQLNQYEECDRERRGARYRARIELFVGTLDESVGLTAEQRRRLIDILSAEIRLPNRSGQHEYYLVMYKASQVPEEKLKGVFDAAQWRVISPTLNQAKGYSSFLKQYGLLTDADEAKPQGDPN